MRNCRGLRDWNARGPLQSDKSRKAHSSANVQSIVIRFRTVRIRHEWFFDLALLLAFPFTLALGRCFSVRFILASVGISQVRDKSVLRCQLAVSNRVAVCGRLE